MYENKVLTLVDLPDDRRAIENKWIFKKKTDADGNGKQGTQMFTQVRAPSMEVKPYFLFD